MAHLLIRKAAKRSGILNSLASFKRKFIYKRVSVDWDDFGGDPGKGEQKAFAEFLNRDSRIIAEEFPVQNGSGKGFILNCNGQLNGSK